MLDTLMVVWTSGMWKRLLRNLGAFLLLFLGICVLLFLVSTSGGRWSSLAVTVTRSSSSAPSGSSTASLSVQPTPAPTALPTTAPYIEPIILQNPILPDRHASRNTYRHFFHRRIPTYTQPIQPTEPPQDDGSQDPTNPNPMQNLP